MNFSYKHAYICILYWSFQGLCDVVDSTCTCTCPEIGRPLSMTANEKQAALDKHNEFRRQASPTASNMLKLEWDEELAKAATKYAAQCKLAYDDIDNLSVPGIPGMQFGENVAAGNFDVVQAIRFWHEGVSGFQYGVGSTEISTQYTQIMNAKTARVGCGWADCSSTPQKKFQVCNYAESQNDDSFTKPYQTGPSCSACPDSCDSSGKLCDCGGKLCIHGGELNINTCQCDCPSNFRNCAIDDPISNTNEKWMAKRGEEREVEDPLQCLSNGVTTICSVDECEQMTPMTEDQCETLFESFFGDD